MHKGDRRHTGWIERSLLLFLAAGAFMALPFSARAAWQLTWSDEFDGPAVDSTKWTFETGNNNGWGNSEREYYTARTNNARVSDGVLHIIAQKESMGGFPYTSARLKSQGLFSKKYGRFEFRAKLPQGVGFWPALWMLGTNISSAGWPACGEIDVMELNGTWNNKVQGTIHYSDASNNRLLQTAYFTLPTSGDSVTNFHIYALEWNRGSIKWIVDNTVVKTWTSWSSSTGPYPAPFDQPFFLLMNLAIGGNYLGNPSDTAINAGTVFPGEMQVDYVRVYDQVITAPESPLGLSATASSAAVQLGWNECSGAGGYIVRRASDSSGPYAVIGTSAYPDFIDATVSSCQSFWYKISATNSIGESETSAPQSVDVPSFALAVNSGGAGTGLFSGDTGFTSGTQAAAVTTAIDRTGASSPAPESIYQTERYGNFTYTFPGLIAGRSYKLRLHFAETYWSAAGQRKFNVFVNGAQVLSNFDIVAAAGSPNKAIVQEFTATPNGGQITIQFATVLDNAKCNGIELLLPRTPAPVVTSNGPLWSGMALTLNASSIPGASYNWTGPNGFTSTLQNPVIENATNSAAGVYTAQAVLAGCASLPASTTVSISPPPTIAVQASATSLVLSWPEGVLQYTTNLGGAWFDVPGATSPRTNTLPRPQEFFRLRH